MAKAKPAPPVHVARQGGMARPNIQKPMTSGRPSAGEPAQPAQNKRGFHAGGTRGSRAK